MVGRRRGVVFDLDDTLYLERDYVRSGYTAVAEAVAPSAGVQPGVLVATMWTWFTDGARTGTFDRLLEEFPEARSAWSVPQLVALYRDHAPSIALSSEVESLLSTLADSDVFLGIVSDGHLPGQQAKARALRLSEKFDAVVFTDQWGPDDWKPGLRGFREIETVSGLRDEELIYIGDNPVKDFVGPIKLGWSAARLRCDGQLHAGEADGPNWYVNAFSAASYQELQALLGRWLEGRTLTFVASSLP